MLQFQIGTAISIHLPPICNTSLLLNNISTNSKRKLFVFTLAHSFILQISFGSINRTQLLTYLKNHQLGKSKKKSIRQKVAETEDLF